MRLAGLPARLSEIVSSIPYDGQSFTTNQNLTTANESASKRQLRQRRSIARVFTDHSNRCNQRHHVVSAVSHCIPLHLLEHSHALPWLPLPPSSACMLSSRQDRDLLDENDTRATINKAVEGEVVGDLAEAVDEVVEEAVDEAGAVVEAVSEDVLMESIGRHKVETPLCQR